MDPVEIIRKDDDIAAIGIKRTRKGLIFTISGHEALEALFQEWGTGEVQPVSAHGRFWQPLGGVSLEVYQLGKDPGIHSTPGGVHYSIAKPGCEILYADQTGRQVLNLSFLRLIGISQPRGRAFLVSGIYSTEIVESLIKQIPLAVERFHAMYLMPIGVELRMTTEVTLS